ncbi:MAG: hypothetical protein PHD15_01975 [Clostridia bacterium]|nr:hypothetical protein [Clostridia bacterium]MDD4386520.1 hypothetical protein [Clostridia bacterium]
MNVNDIINSLNLISEKLFKSVEGEVYTTLDKIVNISPDILKSDPLKNIFFENKINGIILIANSLMMLYITYYMFTQLISLYNGNTTENVYTFIIKLVVIFILVNNSYFICELILNITSEITSSIELYGEDISGQDVTFSNLKEKIISIKDFMKNDLLSLDGLIKGVISFGAITILINFSIRYVTMIFLLIIFPLSLTTLTSSITSGIFKSYFKLFAVTLLTQIVVKLVILIPLMYKDVDSIMYKIILVGTIYIIYKINTFVKELFVKITEESKYSNIFRR